MSVQKQWNLIITDRGRGEPGITLDNIKIAQFINLLLNNQEIREAIDTITSKAVLILGAFPRNGRPPAHFQRNPVGRGQLAVFPRCSLGPYQLAKQCTC
jgi:hypothetical protein